MCTAKTLHHRPDAADRNEIPAARWLYDAGPCQVASRRGINCAVGTYVARRLQDVDEFQLSRKMTLNSRAYTTSFILSLSLVRERSALATIIVSRRVVM